MRGQSTSGDRRSVWPTGPRPRSPSTARREAQDRLRANGAKCTMVFRLTPEEEAFRREVRDWLRENLPKDWSGDRFTRDRDPETWDIYRSFAQKLAAKGWGAPHWPGAYGGRG